MKLFTDLRESVQFLKEANTLGGQDYFISGVFMQAGLKNRNGRIYPRDVMLKEVERYNTEHVARKRAFGELSHPKEPSINMERVSHLIVELRPDGNDILGKAKIMDTPYGKIVKTFIDEGVTLGVSSRGLGSVEEQGGAQIVQNDFYLVTAADIVADPSAPDAFVQNMQEGVEWMFENGEWRTIKDQLHRAAKVDRAEVEKALLESFDRFVSKLAGI